MNNKANLANLEELRKAIEESIFISQAVKPCHLWQGYKA